MRMHHICPWGKTCMYKSYNGGETWTKPMVISDTYVDDRDAGIVYLGKGRLLVTWFTHSAECYNTKLYNDITRRNNAKELMATMGMLASMTHLSEEEGRGGSYFIISNDYGVTWTEPKRIPISAPHGPNVCKDGTLIYVGCPMYSDEGEAPNVPVCVMRSTDGGENWEHTGIIKTPDGYPAHCFCEPHVIELKDGRLMAGIRYSNYGTKPAKKDIFLSFSSDGGFTWSEMKPLGVDGAPPFFMRHSSGAIVCTFGRRLVPFGERAIVSYDEGETWSEQFPIFDDASDPDLGYPSSVELPDGKILTAYYQRFEEDTKASFLYTIWEL
jgi:hypothetical protein